ncbi:MAG: glycosyltransferase [Micrococcales bacterium]|nr:glycosyltransferase [Micrococcales bacterium]
MNAPHLIYLAWGFPPAAKSCTYRMLATANSFVRAGWDVTVITLSEQTWVREHGLDPSLMELVDPRIEVIRLPLFRDDLDTNIRSYSRLRAQRPKEWMRWQRRLDQVDFPEAVFGRWRKPVTEALFAAHERRPADLVLTSASPYTFFAPALALHEKEGVPFVLDYRDAWAIDIINDVPAFSPSSRRGRIEQRLMEAVDEAWFVNSPIRDAYARLYPEQSDRMHVVRNGSDVAVGTDRIPLRQPDLEQGLTFGYLGTITFGTDRTRDICAAWVEARSRNELLRRSRLEFRGHVGAGSARGTNTHARFIHQYAAHDVSLDGPVAKGDTAAVYASWDVLVLCLVGGRYVTSGKVYDYISTGLPVMSVHERDHAAREILQDYPLWVANESLEVEDIADAFVRAAEMATGATVEQREQAREYAHRYERYAQIQPAVDRLSARFGASVPEPAP